MPLNLPLYNPTVRDIPPPQPGTDFVDSALKGYQLGRVMAGIPQQQQALQIAQMQNQLQNAPLERSLLEEQVKNAPIHRQLAIAEGLKNLAPGLVPQPGTRQTLPLSPVPSEILKEQPMETFGASPETMSTRLAGDIAYKPVNDAIALNIPDNEGLMYSPEKAREQALLEKDLADRRFYQHYNYRLENPTAVKPIGYGLNPNSGILEPVTFNATTKQQEFADGTVFKGMPSKPAPVQGEVDKDALNGALEIYKKTGTIPAFGFGNNPLRTAFFAAIGSEGKDIVNEAQATKAERSGMAAAYRTQQNLYQSTKTAANTLDRQLDLVEQLSNKVGRSGMPVINSYLLYLKGDYAGDEDTKALDNAVRTASNEFARILNGQVASIAGSTVSSADEAHKMLNANLTPSQLKIVAKQMKLEGQFRLDSYKNTIDDLTEELNKVGAEKTGEATSENKSKFIPGSIIRQKSTGKTFKVDENGNPQPI